MDDGLGYIGHDQGYFYGGQPWAELCALAWQRVDLSPVVGPLAPPDPRD